MRPLLPCPACSRHVFADEPSCPHCGAAFDAAHAGGRGEPSGSASSTIARPLSATVLAAMALAGIASCSESPPVAVYGPAPDPSGARLDASAAPSSTGTPTAPTPPTSVPTVAPTTSASTEIPPRPPAAVYGPAPRNPDDRVVPPVPKKTP